MARPENLIQWEQATVTIHPDHKVVMEKLVTMWFCGSARNLGDGIAWLVGQFCNTGSVIAPEPAQIIIQKALKARKPH